LHRFAGIFPNFRLQMVVKTWSGCGEMRGKRGFQTPHFWVRKNAPHFSTLFFVREGGWILYGRFSRSGENADRLMRSPRGAV
jgi:hypothetical protein